MKILPVDVGGFKITVNKKKPAEIQAESRLSYTFKH